MALLIAYLSLAIGVSFLCSILEAVLLSITPSFVEAHLQANPKQGEVLARVKSNLDNSISCILILNTFAHTMGAAGVGAQAIQLFGPEWESLIAVMLTLAILYLSEIIPKTLGATYWKVLALPAARIIIILVKLVYPLVWLSSYITKLISKNKSGHVSREEIKAFAGLGYKGGVLGEQENLLMTNILALREITTEQILTPRTVVFALPDDSLVSDALNPTQSERFTRIPIYQESIDQISGVVNRRELLEVDREGKGNMAINQFALPIFHVSQSLPVLHLLDQFINRQEHIFVVEDSFGQTAGIVTLEDAIETLLGREIVDETDTHTDMQVLAKKRFRDRLRERKKLVESTNSEK